MSTVNLRMTFLTTLAPAATVGRQGEDIQQKCDERNQEHHAEGHKDTHQWTMPEENGSRRPVQREHGLVMQWMPHLHGTPFFIDS